MVENSPPLTNKERLLIMNAPTNIREMTAVEIIDTYCNEYGSSKVDGVAVMQDYQQEITVIHFNNVIVKVQNNNVTVVDTTKKCILNKKFNTWATCTYELPVSDCHVNCFCASSDPCDFQECTN